MFLSEKSLSYSHLINKYRLQRFTRAVSPSFMVYVPIASTLFGKEGDFKVVPSKWEQESAQKCQDLESKKKEKGDGKHFHLILVNSL